MSERSALAAQALGWREDRLWAIRPPWFVARLVAEKGGQAVAEGHQSAVYAQAGQLLRQQRLAHRTDAEGEPIRHGSDFLGELRVTKAQEETLTWQGSQDGNVASRVETHGVQASGTSSTIRAADAHAMQRSQLSKRDTAKHLCAPRRDLTVFRDTKHELKM